MSGPRNRARVFLCHSSADKSAVRALYRRLADDGFAPWLDEENLAPGENWELAIRRAVRAADYVVTCLSNAATTRAGYVHKEIKLALDVADEQPEGSVYVIPVRLEVCTIPDRLSHLHWVDLFAENGYARLTRTLSAKAAPPPHPIGSARQASTAATAPVRPATTDDVWRRPVMVPTPGFMVPRPKLVDSVVGALCADRDVAVSTAVEGAGGFGKTILAEQVGRDPRVDDRFPGAVLWASLGPDCTDRVLAKEIFSVASFFKPAQRDPVAPLDPNIAARLLARDLLDAQARGPVLLVIDDVWYPSQLDPFRIIERPCVQLMTTRIRSSVRRLDLDIPAVSVGAMTGDEARELLANGLGDVSHAALEPILEYAQGWALLLAVINGQLRRLLRWGASPQTALATVQRLLRSHGPQAFDRASERDRRDAIGSSLALSLDYLAAEDPAALACYEALAIFEPPEDVPGDLLSAWLDLPIETVERGCLLLADLNLLRRLDFDPLRVRLHDVFLDFLRHHVDPAKLSELRRKLLALDL